MDTCYRRAYTFKRVERAPGEFQIQEISRPSILPSFKTYQIDQISGDIKESICRVSDQLFDDSVNSNIPTVSYELPDGQEIHVGTDRFKAPELLFQPSLLSSYPGVKLTGKGTPASLQSLVLDSIASCDVDVRKELYASVVLTGGTSLLSGLRDRLEKELVVAGPQAAKIKVSMPINTQERRFSVWIGGSILSSLGSFQQMWMSKKEYEEAGASLIHRKAP
ncbi:hypothetical protein CEUSTIGMA_g10540.t1 [Chlamydomonas eustigma]|uniref:Actin-related protein 4 n=1 Tax=Chlamydomonas eustigma TaxID=1157962 RepID=A0A250XJ58_9CHLO|nr:hypothetical protein CEUSTIGMA_g10540.t1 [Chlamydomonas eustigma]|eukprot:GAX83114.1 hypothetical protein CEUSTIGMA_g10540.t1 [Chlamydomonas eustigma]